MIRTLIASVIALPLLLVIAWGGLKLRASLWEWTAPIRFNGDIDNGFRWGNRANDVGYLNLYETVGPPGPGQRFDYGPLRLGAMSSWIAILRHRGVQTDHREADRAYHAPLLTFNTICEAVCALAAAAVVWEVRQWRATNRPLLTALLCTAALLWVWFNPAGLVDAHAWPQWDVWPMPFYLIALYCALRRWWLTAGVLLGVAAMFKGQALAVGWTLPAYALFTGDWRGALRCVAGTAAAIFLVGAPWIVSSFDTVSKTRALHPPAIVLPVLATLTAALLPRRPSAGVVCGVLAATLYLSMHWFGGTDYWLRSGLEVGTWHYRRMVMGPNPNLAGLLEVRYGWEDIDTPLFTLPALQWNGSDGAEQYRIGGLITLRSLLLTLFFALSLVAVARGAWLGRKKDPRVLLAITLPWLLFFMLPCQIHQRYLVFGAIAAATWVASGLGATLLGALVVIAGTTPMLQTMLQNGDQDWRQWQEAGSAFDRLLYFIEGTYPGLAWMLLLLTLILFAILFRRHEREVPNGHT